MPQPRLAQPCRLQSIFQRIRHISSRHRRGQAPRDDVARVIIQNRRQELPDPTDYSEIGEVRLPQLMYSASRVLESIRRMYHCELWAGDQVVSL